MPDTEGPQSRARVIRERTIQAEVRARIHQGMDHEECAAVAAATRDEFADVPLPTPMSRLQVAIRKAGGWLTTDGWRERESFAMATEEETKCLRTLTPKGRHGRRTASRSDQPTPEDRAALDEMLAEGPPASRFPAEVYEAALRMKYALHDDPAIGSEELARDIEVVVSHVLAALEPASAASTRVREEARVDPTKVIGICRNPGEPFYWDAERIGEPCPDADCSRNAEDAGLEPPRHGYYVLASTTEAPDDE